MRAPGVFVCYRREDSSGHAGRIYDRLREQFGSQRVFMDVDTIRPGMDFVDRIDEALDECGTLLAIIGREWIDVSSNDQRRIDDENDFVRLEIKAALERGIPVLPVLVQGATMPTPAQLPEPLRALARRAAIVVDDTRWSADVDRLVGSVEYLLTDQDGSASPLDGMREPSPVPMRNHQRRRILVATGMVAALVAVALGTWILASEKEPVLEAGSIAFVVTGGRGSVMVRDPSGSTSQLTKGTCPAWSPEGTMLVTKSPDPVVVDLAGDRTALLPAAWRSSDTIGFADPGVQFWVRNLDWSFRNDIALATDRGIIHLGTSVSSQVPVPGGLQALTWSPDGARLAYVRSGPASTLSVADRLGRDPTVLVEEDTILANPSWSPDGTTIAYTRVDPATGLAQIWLVRADGDQEPSLLETSGGIHDDRDATWTTSGQQIVFVSRRNGQVDLYAVRPDGSGLLRITNTPAEEACPDFTAEAI